MYMGYGRVTPLTVTVRLHVEVFCVENDGFQTWW